MLSTVLTLEISFGPGMDKMKVLLGKHENINCVGLKTCTLERYCVLSTQEDSFNSNSRTCDTDNLDLSHMN